MFRFKFIGVQAHNPNKSNIKQYCVVFTVKIKYTVKPKCIQTPSTFLTLSQFIHYSLENEKELFNFGEDKLCQKKMNLDNVR